MTTLVFDVSGFEEVDEVFGGVEARLQDARPVWDDIADAITDDQTAWFDSQGEGTWSPLTPRYQAWKAREHPSKPDGVLTEGLRDSVTGRGGARYSVRRWDADSLEVGTEDPVAHLQRDAGRPPLGDVLEGEERFYSQLLGRYVLYGEQS